MISVRVEGLREIEAALDQLEKRATRKAVGRRVLKKAGQPLADDMNRLAPDDPETPGGLNRSYAVSTKLNASQRREANREGRDDVYMYVGTNDPAGVQQEFGNVNHGPQPHARPAWDAGKQRTLDIIVDEFRDEIDNAVRRQSARAARLAARG